MHLLPYALSSHLMTRITEFRNPCELEEAQKVIKGKERALMTPPLNKRVVVAEIGFALTSLVALVETLVYSLLLIPFALVYPISKTPARMFHLLIDSSANSLEWAVKSLYYNFRRHQLPSSELLTGIRQFHIEHNSLNRILALQQIGCTPDKNMEEGIKLLNRLLEDPQNKELKKELKEEEESAYNLLSFLVVVECLYKEESSSYFSEKTQIRMRACKEEGFFTVKLEQFLQDYRDYLRPKWFELLTPEQIQDPTDRELFTEIKAIASEAMQGSPLFTTILIAYKKKKVV